MALERLSPEDIDTRLKAISDWRVEDGHLKKDFEFPDFKTAFGFMAKLAEVAEQMNHHPDWSNSYNKVSISLTTHSARGLTQNDFSFAASADEAFLGF